jgi:hypothetical protein
MAVYLRLRLQPLRYLIRHSLVFERRGFADDARLGGYVRQTNSDRFELCMRAMPRSSADRDRAPRPPPLEPRSSTRNRRGRDITAT